MQVLTAKYASPRIGNIPEADLSNRCEALMFKIHIVTGWTIPDNDLFRVVLEDQLQKKLIEDCCDLNISEIEYAFRKFGTEIKDWGKAMNLSLFDEVILKYRVYRRQVSDFEEHKSCDANLKKLPPSKTDWIEMCEHYYQRFRSGDYNIDFWPAEMYDEFVKHNYIAPDVYKEFIDRSSKRLYHKYLKKIEDAKIARDKKAVIEYEKKITDLVNDEYYLVISYAKRLSIKLLYEEAKKQGFENLFIKEDNL